MWFIQLMVPMVKKIRQQYRVLAYVDDFLIHPVKARREASVRYCQKATQVIYTGDRQAALIIRLATASDGGGMGREYSGGTPWLRDRLVSHAFLHSAAKK
jgi:hypothetical protein